MGSFRSSVVVVCLALAAGCGSDDVSVERAECEAGGLVVALNRNSGESVGLAEVVVADRDGNVVLATGDWVATRPSFSPDGRRLVVVRADGDYESAGPASTSLWTLNTDGTEPQALTERQQDDYPAWSPDGSTIAFSRRASDAADHAREIHTVPARGGDARPLVPNDGSDDIAPAWAPDGRMLAFIRTVSQTDGNRTTTVWVVGADGSNARPVAPVPDAHSLQWHPQENLVLVNSFGAEDGVMALVDVDSGDIRGIADDATFAGWSSAGSEIYYFTKEGASQPSWWRLAQGRVVGDRVQRDRYVGQIEEYLYPYFGLAVSPCP
jgi:Tol biopolymer transport system component